MSRGTTRRSAFGRRTRTVPNSSRSVTKARPSGPPTKPPLRLRSIEGDRARRRRLPHPLDDRDRVAGLAEDVGQARRLVGGEDDPGAVGSPGRRRPRQVDRHDRAAGPARASRTGRPTTARRGPSRRPRAGPDSQVSSRVRERDEAALPVARRQVRRRPVLRQLAGLDQLGAPLVGLAPQERRRPRRCRRARRARAGCPDRCGRGRSPGRGGRPRPRRRHRRPSPGSPSPRRRRPRSGSVVEAGEVRGEALRESRGGPAEAVADRGGATRRAAGTPTRAAGRPRRSRPSSRWSVGSNERSESISSPKNSIRIGSAIDGGKTSTIPPRRANSPRPATSLTGT